MILSIAIGWRDVTFWTSRCDSWSNTYIQVGIGYIEHFIVLFCVKVNWQYIWLTFNMLWTHKKSIYYLVPTNVCHQEWQPTRKGPLESSFLNSTIGINYSYLQISVRFSITAWDFLELFWLVDLEHNAARWSLVRHQINKFHIFSLKN